MRIGHVAPLVYPVPPSTYGGTERVIADLATAQAALGHDVVLFASEDSGLERVTLLAGRPSLAGWKAQGSEPPPGLLAALEADQLRQLLAHGSECDVIHLHGPAQSSAVAESLGIPVFRTIHWRADELDHKLHFELFPKERVIAISERQAKDIPSSSLAGTVHHGIPVDRYALGTGSGGYLAFLGRMTDQKRPDRAIALGASANLPVKLAGPVDPGNPDYFERVVRPKLSANVQHVGSVTDAQKQAFLGDAAALVFPIDWPEPFGLVMIEAMACGTPVLAWRNGSVAEVVDEGVSGIIVNDMAEASARLPELLTLDRGKVRKRFEERFGVGRMAAAITALYRAA
ncbi:glycosyltransferase family 4 protein [Paraurantiacibacter namhicola]|uniref:Glycogen synthase n=1 Tax=Paraurantiacibacter namhicola TaxID=645517 RepID=A0A1C7DBC4_9SPHN|nr:glycosyltransferase family 4 protein [Paraurantiacibacter namhicola]ANU08682.1 Glycogen synthase [Paraurantiacibacter namhicola]